MPEAPYQRDWKPVGERHGLRISHATTAPEPGAWIAARGQRVTTFSVTGADGALVLRHEVPYVLAADWVSALIAVLDVPAGRLPPADGWGERPETLATHRRQLKALPQTDEQTG
jgi:hypothetical protein